MKVDDPGVDRDEAREAVGQRFETGTCRVRAAECDVRVAGYAEPTALCFVRALGEVDADKMTSAVLR